MLNVAAAFPSLKEVARDILARSHNVQQSKLVEELSAAITGAASALHVEAATTSQPKPKAGTPTFAEVAAGKAGPAAEQKKVNKNVAKKERRAARKAAEANQTSEGRVPQQGKTEGGRASSPVPKADPAAAQPKASPPRPQKKDRVKSGEPGA